MAAAQQLAPVDQEPEQALTWLPVEEDRARNGWRPFRPTQPCGLSDCKTPRDFSHSTEPKLVVEPCDDLRPETARIFQEFIDQEDIEISRHEIAHAFMAIAVGCRVFHVQSSRPQPFCHYTATEAFGDTIMITLAPAACDGRKSPPTKDDARLYLNKVRQNTHGSCDFCSIAEKLRAVPDNVITDDTLALAWMYYYRRCVAFFEHADVRPVLDHLAAELREKRMLTGEQVHALSTRRRSGRHSHQSNRRRTFGRLRRRLGRAACVFMGMRRGHPSQLRIGAFTFFHPMRAADRVPHGASARASRLRA
jgi:hypothetical protein